MIGAFRWLALAIAVTLATSAKAEDAHDLATKPRRGPLAAAAAIVPVARSPNVSTESGDTT